MKPLDYDKHINGYDLFVSNDGVDLYEKVAMGYNHFVSSKSMNDLSDTTDTDMIKNSIIQGLWGELNDK